MESPEYSGMSCAGEVGRVYTSLGLDHCQRLVELSNVIQSWATEDSYSENESENSKLMKNPEINKKHPSSVPELVLNNLSQIFFH